MIVFVCVASKITYNFRPPIFTTFLLRKIINSIVKCEVIMDKFLDKNKRLRPNMPAEPTKQCQYGSKCYRKNPHHFTEYAHKHLSDILAKGMDDDTNQYQIPDEFFMSKDIILEQIKILEKLFPSDEGKSTSKKVKTEQNEEAESAKNCTTPKRTLNESRNEDNSIPKSTTSITAAQLRESLKAAMAKNLNSPISCSPQPSTSRQMNIENTPKLPKPSESSNCSLADTEPSTSSLTMASSTSTSTITSSKESKSTVKRNIHDYISVVLPKGEMAKKLEKAAPYNFFLTTITDSKPTHKESLSVTLQELLDPSLGEIECSVQINFMVDIGWLLGHYYFADCLETPLLVLYGEETPDLKMISTKKPQVTAIKVAMSSPFATHHTKMMLFGYKDGSMRVIVSTANLIEDDWHNRTQGIWISPKCKALPLESDTAAGESPTGFKEGLVRYLVSYNIPKLQQWITRVRKSDFSDVNVFFVASVPGGHRETPQKGHLWGHARLGYLLSKHSAPIDDSCPIVAQSSSIGSLGPSIQSWITTDLIHSWRKDSAPTGLRKIPTFKMIYPSFNNVKNSHDDLLGGGCLPYRKAVNDKQLWFKAHLHQWKSKCRHRNQAMPHIKTYCRWSDRGLYWFVLTSANLSKAAWGSFNKGAKIDVPLRIMNYEAGILFLPKFVLGENERFFPMNVSKNGHPVFPIPYDIPLTPFNMDDTPFVMDYLL